MRRGYAAVLTAVVITALAAFGVWQVRPPEAVGPGAPASEFSAARAMPHLAAIAAEPHPLASDANRRVRDLLVERLEAAGFEAWVQRDAVVPESDRNVVAYPENVLGRLPGRRESGEVVLLVAHYDSVPVSPGAADNGTSVATLLEVARALRAGPRLEHDVLIAFTDGEEYGLLGARAFLQDAWARRVGLVLNFDNPGSSGPSVMYETSAQSAPLVRTFAEAVAAPFASSLADEMARRRWIESDFTLLRNDGRPGMTFGFTEGFVRNHSMLDTVAHIDPGSLQHQGEYALDLARAFADGPGELRGGESVYFNVVDGVLVVYPRLMALPLALGAAVLYATALGFGLRRRRLTLSGLASGAVNSLLSLIFMAALTALIWALVSEAYGAVSSALPFYNDDLHRAGLTALVLAIGLTVYLWGLDRAKVLDTAAAALLWWVLLGVYFSAALPGASYLIVWPLVAALAALLATLFMAPLHREDGSVSPAPLVVLLAGAAPAVLLASSSLYLLFVASGIRVPVIVVSVWLLLSMLVLHFDMMCYPRRWPLPAVLAAVGVILFIGLSPATGYGDDWPHTDSLLYRVDHSARSAAWVTLDEEFDAWTGRVLDAAGRRTEGHEHVPLFGFLHYQQAPAETTTVPRPRLEVLEDRAGGGRRDLALRLWSPRLAPFASVLLENEAGDVIAAVDGAAVAGGDTTFLDYSAEHWHVDVLNLPAGGVTLRLTVDAGVPLHFRVVDLSYGLSPAAQALAGTRPEGFVPGGNGDATVVSCGYALAAKAGRPLRTVFY